MIEMGGWKDYLRGILFASAFATQWEIYPLGREGFNSRMDIFDIRLFNLRVVLQEKFGDRQANLAAALGRQPSYIWRMLNQDSPHWKKMGEDIARQIERVCELEIGWMDRQHDNLSAAAVRIGKELDGRIADPDLRQEVAAYIVSSIDQLAELLRGRGGSRSADLAVAKPAPEQEEPAKGN